MKKYDSLVGVHDVRGSRPFLSSVFPLFFMSPCFSFCDVLDVSVYNVSDLKKKKKYYNED